MQLTDDARDSILLKRPAHAIYCGPADILSVVSWSGNTLVTGLTVTGRFLGLDGEVRYFSERHVPNTDRTFNATTHQLGEGWLLSLLIVANSTPSLGQIFARVGLSRGAGVATTAHSILAQGVVSNLQGLAWPGSPITDSINRPGFIRELAGTDPAAGVECSDTVPSGARWSLRAYTVPLVADGTAANRFPTLVIDDGSLVMFRAEAPEAVVASQTRTFQASPGTDRLVSVSGFPSWNVPIGLQMFAGCRIRTSTTNLQAGDNWGSPIILVEEWLEAR